MLPKLERAWIYNMRFFLLENIFKLHMKNRIDCSVINIL